MLLGDPPDLLGKSDINRNEERDILFCSDRGYYNLAFAKNMQESRIKYICTCARNQINPHCKHCKGEGSDLEFGKEFPDTGISPYTVPSTTTHKRKIIIHHHYSSSSLTINHHHD
eukprot:Awhi_evm1s13634